MHSIRDKVILLTGEDEDEETERWRVAADRCVASE